MGGFYTEATQYTLKSADRKGKERRALTSLEDWRYLEEQRKDFARFYGKDHEDTLRYTTMAEQASAIHQTA
jgi:hypothetical protein